MSAGSSAGGGGERGAGAGGVAPLRILVAGGGGLLGGALLDAAGARGHRTAAPPRRDFDLLDPTSLEREVDACGPDWVVNCAAWTDVDGAEAREEEARAVNALGAEALARAARDGGARFLHVSTDYVFDGTATAPVPEDAPRRPVNAYGRTKAEGEERVEAVGGELVIARTSWLYGREGHDFVTRILAKAERGEALRVVDDQTGRPTWSRSLARSLVALMEAEARGLIHVADSGEASWYALAREALGIRGISVPLEPVPSSAYPTPAPRPGYSVLALERAEAILGAPPAHWTESLEAYLAPVPEGQAPVR